MFSKSMEMLVNILTYVILAFLLERMRRFVHRPFSPLTGGGEVIYDGLNRAGAL